MNMYKKRKRRKIPQNCHFFKKKDLNFAISLFSKFFKHFFFYKFGAWLEVNLQKKFEKNKNTETEIEKTNRPNCSDYSDGLSETSVKFRWLRVELLFLTNTNLK